MKTTPIKALFTDIGGVLLTNGWDRTTRQKAIEIFDLNEDETNERHAMAFDTFEQGKMSLDQYLDFVVFFQKRSFSKEKFKDFVYEQSQPYPEMLKLFKDLKIQFDLKVVGISNEGRELMEYRSKKFKLNELLDFFVCSGFVGMRKPDPHIFKLALDLSQNDPKEIIYIDDRKPFVDMAVSFGMEGIHHTDIETTKKLFKTVVGSQ